MKFEQELINRVKAPTPNFFKTVRRIGLTLSAAGTALLTAPVAVTAVAGYLVVVGLVATAVSSAAVADGNGDTGNPPGGTPAAAAGNGEGGAL